MIPSSVNILGLDFAVALVPVVDKMVAADGQIDFSAQTISIDESISEQKQEQVLMHEIVHGIFDQLGFSEQSEDEQLVQSLAVALHQTLRPFGALANPAAAASL